MPDEIDVFVNVDDIIVPRKRMRVANHIEELAGSIAKNGMLHPVTLRRENNRLILIAGLRRLTATKFLGLDRIQARILDIDKTNAMLIEIDENLQRVELNALERAEHISERKKVWEALHPTTKHGGAPGAGRGKGKKKPPTYKDVTVTSFQNGQPDEPVRSFTKETASVTQESTSTVERFVRIGDNICTKAKEILAGTKLKDRETDLLKVARLDHDTQVKIAELCRDRGITTYQRAWKTLESERIAAEPQPLPSGPFRVIVADPPWAYNKRPDDFSKRENTNYATMDLEAIKGLEVKQMAADDAVLWLWTTNAHLPEAFGVAKAWGFTYKTLLTWDKVRVGMGDWLRGQTEHCLMCVRGSPSLPLTNQTTMIRETSKGHSAKPEAFYRLVETLCSGSKIELFARVPRGGWTSWGSEPLYDSEETALLNKK